MRIGELALVTGVSVRALRHYEQEGLIRPGRGGNGYRDFDDDAIEAVRQIRGLLDAGLPIRLIREILPYLDGPTDLLPQVPCSHMLEQVARQRDQLDRRIEYLTRNRDALSTYLQAARTAAGAAVDCADADCATEPGAPAGMLDPGP
ncbi:DNA-binding transcriptional regulator, MerR family [Micromonospora citrea]|uniref:DNA-binding transcriptional regulator, MerR family n=1 Tax=Micromonospora citrea TaxID=47855 RepID=A0A1C6TWE3_9ACTN|nr:MerR family transcriptional regulator [Micromonospora citrea]SCL46077.1 DNA-binding transcriptional regulator, MerR family [Micromonospora citrea]